MFRNYMKIEIRNLIRNKLYSAVNTIGLSPPVLRPASSPLKEIMGTYFPDATSTCSPILTATGTGRQPKSIRKLSTY
jgi:hypothetical protein